MTDLFGDYRPETPFTDRIVCSMGTFRQSPKVLQQRLREMGADYKASARVGRGTHYCLVGENPPQEQMDYLETLAYNGYAPRVLHQQELDDIFSGHYSPYVVPSEVQKNLRLSMRHYEQSHVDYSSGLNPLYMLELYLSPDLETPQEQLYQMLGERGIYANPYIDETTDVLVVGSQTMEALRTGRTDSTIQYIQETYNKSRAQSYRYVMTTEQELWAFLN